MEKYEFTVGRHPVQLEATSGYVTGLRTTNVSNISSTPGGHVVSRHHAFSDFSLTGLNGRETPIKTALHDLFLRNGSRASVVSISSGKNNYFGLVLNHDTGDSIFVNHGSSFIKRLGIQFPTWPFIAIGAAAFLFIGSRAEKTSSGSVDPLSSAAILVLIGCLAGWGYTGIRNSLIWKNSVEPELNSYMRHLKKNTATIFGHSSGEQGAADQPATRS